MKSWSCVSFSLIVTSRSQKIQQSSTMSCQLCQCACLPHSILSLVMPSLVSTMPWKPILPLARALSPLPPLPLPLVSLLGVSFLPPRSPPPPLLPGREPHGACCIGLCMMGEPWTLIPGDTARRLKLTGSRSSSRRRFVSRRVTSATEGGNGCSVVGMEEDPLGWGVSLPELGVVVMGNMKPPLPPPGPEFANGESMFMSSRLIPEEDPRGGPGGGGVVLEPPTLLVSEKFSQNTFPFEFLWAWCLKLLERPSAFESTIIASSTASSSESWMGMLGLDCVVAATDAGCGVWRGGSKSMSSRT